MRGKIYSYARSSDSFVPPRAYWSTRIVAIYPKIWRLERPEKETPRCSLSLTASRDKSDCHSHLTRCGRRNDHLCVRQLGLHWPREIARASPLFISTCRLGFYFAWAVPIEPASSRSRFSSRAHSNTYTYLICNENGSIPSSRCRPCAKYRTIYAVHVVT